MNELRWNPLSQRWVTIATDRASRPQDFAPRRLQVEADLGRPCPFCPGNEEETPPALETYGPQGKWLVRVVPNLYPAFAGSGRLETTQRGPAHRRASANGIHEVLVFSPEHSSSWADLDDRQAGLVMAAIRDRVEDHARSAAVEYTQVIVNYGREAGASIEHPHGQLLGIPFVPGEITEELAAFSQPLGDEPGEGGLLTDVLRYELASGQRIVHDEPRVTVLCPYWSGSPYEMLVAPKAQVAHLDKASPRDVAAVGRALRTALAKLRLLLDDVAYNLVFHSAPHGRGGPPAPFHWHVHVVPAVTTVAGFEMGTGVKINVVEPEAAAAQLRDQPG
ncbi:MAG: galactose-1-phosphate uridylyltransferase [Acidimicrobiales bacterium]